MNLKNHFESPDFLTSMKWWKKIIKCPGWILSSGNQTKPNQPGKKASFTLKVSFMLEY